MLPLLFQTDLVCRLVRGTSLRKFVSDMRMRDAPSTLQHKQVVMEIAAQLLQVGMQHLAMLS